MANSTKIDRDVELLHPAIRDKVKAIRDQLHKEKIPFDVYEAFRTPERQAYLYSKGRTRKGSKVTWVGPWGSIHQYGLAVDFVLTPFGSGSWDTSGKKAKWWARMHEIAKENGMTPLYNKKGQLIEQPHIQLVGVKTKDLKRGIYPDGGDLAWAERLSELIDGWDHGGAPPKPDAMPSRPPLDADILAEMEEDPGASASTAESVLTDAEADARFAKLHAFVKQWEGGFVNHPRDKGGATNMGITIGTLAAHRGTEVTVADVENLSRAEADAIFRKSYYTANRCGEMPERMAMVVYNAAVLSGPKRSIGFVQKGFNALGMTADGKALEEDGILGPITMAALKKTDPAVLAEAFMDQQEVYLRGLEDFDVFGAGWMNRMASLREFVATLPQGAGLRPKTVMKISNNKLDLDIEDLLPVLLAAGTGGKSAVIKALVAKVARDKLIGDGDVDAKDLLVQEALRKLLGEEAVETATNPPALTPVNAALGEGIGRMLNGKKSVSGILGLFLTVILGQNADGGAFGQLGTFFSEYGTELITLFATVTGWGFLGKIDKAIREVRTLRGG